MQVPEDQDPLPRRSASWPDESYLLYGGSKKRGLVLGS